MYLSCHVPMTADGQVLPPDLEQQWDQVFRNLDATLADAGASSRNLARMNVAPLKGERHGSAVPMVFMP